MPTFHVSQHRTICPEHWRVVVTAVGTVIIGQPARQQLRTSTPQREKRSMYAWGKEMHCTPLCLPCRLSAQKLCAFSQALRQLFCQPQGNDGGTFGDGYAKFPHCAATLAPLTIPLNDAVNGIFQHKVCRRLYTYQPSLHYCFQVSQD